MPLTAEEILGADDLPVRELPIPQWGEGATVYLRKLAATENEQCQQISKAADGDRVFLGRFAAMVLCDAEGKRLFADDDAAALGEKSMETLGLIVEAGQEHNGMTENARKATEKNSETSQD